MAATKTRLWCADYESDFEVKSSKSGELYIISARRENLLLMNVLLECTCPAWRYSPDDNKHCKHTLQVWKEACFWTAGVMKGGSCQIKPVRRPVETIEGKRCPNCSGPVIN